VLPEEAVLCGMNLSISRARFPQRRYALFLLAVIQVRAWYLAFFIEIDECLM
jgi:hypothetical protein